MLILASLLFGACSKNKMHQVRYDIDVNGTSIYPYVSSYCVNGKTTSVNLSESWTFSYNTEDEYVQKVSCLVPEANCSAKVYIYVDGNKVASDEAQYPNEASITYKLQK